jgi:hypothetical protein
MIKTLTAAIVATILLGTSVNATPPRNDQNKGGEQNQLQGQLQGQESNNRNSNKVNSTNLNGNINSNRSNSNSEAAAGSESNSSSGSVSGASSSNTNYTGTSSNSDATGGAAGIDSSIGNTLTGGSTGVNSSINQEGDTTIFLPDPIQLQNAPDINVTPGITVSCNSLSMEVDYTGKTGHSFSLYVIGFGESRIPDKIPSYTKDAVGAVVACGLGDQLVDQLTGEGSLLTDAEKAAIQRLVGDQLLYQMYKQNGMEYKPRYMDLESINRTPVPSLD